jgi:putative flippase GtrA
MQIEIAMPVHNEEDILADSIRRLSDRLRAGFPFSTALVIVDNASTDSTWSIAQRLAEELPDVRAVRLAEKGRGRALKAAWLASDADVLAYMDIDLSTDLDALLPLVAPLVSGHSDLAIGTRLARGSRVVRGPKRELISRSYNLVLRAALWVRFSDAQCGFKAIRSDRARALLPLVKDDAWFFDTELLVLAQRCGLRIHEVPVDWVDDPDSRVDVLATSLADLRGIARLGRGLATGTLPLPELAATSRAAVRDRHAAQSHGLLPQLIRFALVGLASTAFYTALYLVLRAGLSPQSANALALGISALANTAVNRRFTFDVRGRTHALRHQAKGLVAFAVGLILTAGSLGLVHLLAPDSGRAVEVAVLAAANVAATLVRFAMFRAWIFPGRRRAPAPGGGRPDGLQPTTTRQPTMTRGSH